MNLERTAVFWDDLESKLPHSQLELSINARRCFAGLLLAIYGFLSMALPLVGMAIYRANLEAKGIFLEEGCHGPDVFVGPFTGILFSVFLKFGFLPFFDVDSKVLSRKSGNLHQTINEPE